VLERHATGDVRVWVPSCSSGEEAYSVAMLFRERTERLQRPPKIQIFATDIDASALAEARRGRYTSAVEKQVSPERLARFFVKRGDSYTVTKDIRDLCIFTPHDLLKDPPFSRMDLVCCRNLLIYLEPVLQRRVIETSHYALRPDATRSPRSATASKSSSARHRAATCGSAPTRSSRARSDTSPGSWTTCSTRRASPTGSSRSAASAST
jgi:chemotaxis methyl-accepting protein methylase